MTLTEVKSRLSDFGHTATDQDDQILTFIMSKTENYVKSNCNLTTIPDALHEVVIDMVVGEFFKSKKDSGQDLTVDVSVVESIQEGDTTIKFAKGETPGEKLDALINWLIGGRLSELNAFRRFKW